MDLMLNAEVMYPVAQNYVHFWKQWTSRVRRGKSHCFKFFSDAIQILCINAAELFFAGYFYFLPGLVIYFISIFGQRALSTDIKIIDVAGIAEIDLKDFENNKAFLAYYNSVSKI